MRSRSASIRACNRRRRHASSTARPAAPCRGRCRAGRFRGEDRRHPCGRCAARPEIAQRRSRGPRQDDGIRWACGGARGRCLGGLHLPAGETDLAIEVDAPKGSKLGDATFAAHFANGVRLRAYRFDKYRTTEKPDAKPRLVRSGGAYRRPAGARRRYAPSRQHDRIGAADPRPGQRAGQCDLSRQLRGTARALSALGLKVEVLGRDTPEEARPQCHAGRRPGQRP